MGGEDLVRRCDDHLEANPIAAEMTFVDGGLTFGAGTRLAKLGAPIDEPRLAALLTSAHGGPIEASRVRHVRPSVETWRNDDRALALMHLALSRLSKLVDPLQGARQLFLADALIEAGVAPNVIVAALTDETETNGALATKFDPDQPRVPAATPTAASGRATNRAARRRLHRDTAFAIRARSSSRLCFPTDARKNGPERARYVSTCCRCRIRREA